MNTPLKPPAKLAVGGEKMKLAPREILLAEQRAGMPWVKIGQALQGDPDIPMGAAVASVIFVALRRSNPGIPDDVLWEAALDADFDDVMDPDGPVDPQLPPPPTP